MHLDTHDIYALLRLLNDSEFKKKHNKINFDDIINLLNEYISFEFQNLHKVFGKNNSDRLAGHLRLLQKEPELTAEMAGVIDQFLNKLDAPLSKTDKSHFTDAILLHVSYLLGNADKNFNQGKFDEAIQRWKNAIKYLRLLDQVSIVELDYYELSKCEHAIGLAYKAKGDLNNAHEYLYLALGNIMAEIGIGQAPSSKNMTLFNQIKKDLEAMAKLQLNRQAFFSTGVTANATAKAPDPASAATSSTRAEQKSFKKQ